MATTSVTLSGFVFDNAGNAVQDAAVVAYTSADNATSAISGLTDTTDANGRWDITTTNEAQYPMDIKITFGSAVRWIKAANGINLTRLTVSGAAVFGENDTGVDVTMYGATSGRYLLWDESEDALQLNDSTELKIGSLAAGDMILYHDGTNSYITNATGALKIATESAGVAVTIGNGTSEVTVADNLTVSGNLTVTGTTTSVDSTTINVTNAFVFEGATADAYETTLGIIDPTADATINLPAMGAGTYYLPVFAAASTTSITATPAEINLIDGGTARGTDAIGDGDGVLINDGGTMRMTTVETLAAYLDDEITAMPNLVTVATIGTGVWAATDVAVAHGGTGASTATAGFDALSPMTAEGDVLYGGSSGTVTKLAKGSDADVLTLASGVPSWATPTTGDVTAVTAGVGLSGGGSSGALTLTLDLSELSTVTPADGDFFSTLDSDGANEQKTTTTALATLFAGTSLTASSSVIGVDDDFLKNDANDVTTGTVTSAGFVLADAANVSISVPLLANADHTTSGITAEMLAGGAISAFDLVCVHTTTQEVLEADASAYATARVIGIAPAAISDTATGTILLQGFIRDDTWTWTTGSTLYLSETAGAMTHTAPTTDGAFVQVVGVALSPDVVYFNPSMDVIEHA